MPCSYAASDSASGNCPVSICRTNCSSFAIASSNVISVIDNSLISPHPEEPPGLPRRGRPRQFLNPAHQPPLMQQCFDPLPLGDLLTGQDWLLGLYVPGQAITA